jgi:hypothetical protein
MCNCNKYNSEICSLKLKFANYVNDNMIKETNMALELLRNINCDNLEEVKKELTKIVGDEIIEEKVIESTVGIASTNGGGLRAYCEAEFKKCMRDTNNDINKCSIEQENCILGWVTYF